MATYLQVTVSPSAGIGASLTSTIVSSSLTFGACDMLHSQPRWISKSETSRPAPNQARAQPQNAGNNKPAIAAFVTTFSGNVILSGLSVKRVVNHRPTSVLPRLTAPLLNMPPPQSGWLPRP